MTMYSWIFLIFCWLSKGPGKHGGRWQQGRSMVGQCHSYLEFMTKQIELLFNHFIIWIGSICYFKLTFWKNHSHNFSMFCDILSSWKWLACLSKISILGSLYFRKLKSQTKQSWLIFWMNKFKMLLHSTFLRMTMIIDRAVVQSFLYMNWFSMIFQIDFTEES